MSAAKFVVGVTDHMIGQPDLEAALLGDGVEVDFFGATEETGFDPARLRRLDALMLWGARLGHDSIAHLTRCRGVVRYGVGYEKVDLAALAEAGIPFANNPDCGTEEVADHALAMILSLQRRLWEHDARARPPPHGLAGSQPQPAVAVKPLHGGRGRRQADRNGGDQPAAALRLRLLGYDPYQPPGHEKAVGYGRTEQIGDLLARSDIVTRHCPANDPTRSLLGAAGLALIKPGAILVNTARISPPPLTRCQSCPRRRTRCWTSGGNGQTGWAAGRLSRRATPSIQITPHRDAPKHRPHRADPADRRPPPPLPLPR